MSILKTVSSLLLAGVVFAGSGFGADSGSSGVARVRLIGGELHLEAKLPDGHDCGLLQLRPHEKASGGRRVDPQWHRANGLALAKLNRFDGKVDNAFACYQLVDGTSGTPFGEARWVGNIESTAKRTFSFPNSNGIKGLQCIVDIDDALQLGVKQAGINVTVDQLVDWGADSGRYSRKVDGKTVWFHAGYVSGLDSRLKRFTDAGIESSLIIYNRVPRSRNGSPLIHPDTDLAKSPFHVAAFNLSTADGVRTYRAAIEFLADRYSNPERKSGLAKRFIIGNEIQSHWYWYNLGEMPRQQVVEDYHKALRVAHLAAHGVHPEIQLYISLDHHWSTRVSENPLHSMSGKYFIDTLNAIVRAGGNFDWHVAFHPYPENLFDPRTWEDTSATSSFDTEKITLKNIELLPAYLRQKQFLYSGKQRRIILSEQGFHSANSEGGERDQAAAYAYAYYRVQRIDGIDAFILHRHVDHPGEGGLRLGLRSSRDGGERSIYRVFRRADTPEWLEAFKFALPVIGVKSWPETLPK